MSSYRFFAMSGKPDHETYLEKLSSGVHPKLKLRGHLTRQYRFGYTHSQEDRPCQLPARDGAISKCLYCQGRLLKARLVLKTLAARTTQPRLHWSTATVVCIYMLLNGVNHTKQNERVTCKGCIF